MRKLLHILLYIKYKTGGLVIKIVDIRYFVVEKSNFYKKVYLYMLIFFN